MAALLPSLLPSLLKCWEPMATATSGQETLRLSISTSRTSRTSN
jgi:hypothetical protein